MRLSRWTRFAFLMCLALAVSSTGQAAEKGWPSVLREELIRIDHDTPGELGVFVKRLKDGSRLEYNANRSWYLSSTVKIPVAIALLQKEERGAISLEKRLTLKKSDYVDGSGDINWSDPGARFSVAQLLRKMLVQSDSTATDMLIRLIGEAEVNANVQRNLAPYGGFGTITALLAVRHQAFGMLHPRAAELTNMDFIELKKISEPEKKLAAFSVRLGLSKDDLKVKSIDEAFERYYETGMNSGRLESFGFLLEKLVTGKLLSRKNTKLMLGHMEASVTGEKRIKAGLPVGMKFAQKTGTQVRRICNVGIIRTFRNSNPVVIAACGEKFPEQTMAETALERIGSALSTSGVFEQD